MDFNKWLDSVGENVSKKWASGKNMTPVNGNHELKIERFRDFMILSALPLAMDANWLICNVLFDDQEDATFHIIKPGENVIRRNFLQARSGLTLIIGQEFFRPNECPLIGCALQHMRSQVCYPLTALQKDDLLLITEKIEDVSRGGYLFKNEYLQQLLLQIMHFALKNFSSCKQSDASELPLSSGMCPVIFNGPVILAN